MGNWGKTLGSRQLGIVSSGSRPMGLLVHGMRLLRHYRNMDTVKIYIKKIINFMFEFEFPALNK